MTFPLGYELFGFHSMEPSRGITGHWIFIVLQTSDNERQNIKRRISIKIMINKKLEEEQTKNSMK